MDPLVRIQSVQPLEEFVVRLTFTDGSVRDTDLQPYLHGPVFNPIKADRALFESVSIDPRMGTIVWPNGADIDPDVLYLGLAPAWMTEQSAVPERRSWPTQTTGGSR
jgi:hypothetical protein